MTRTPARPGELIVMLDGFESMPYRCKVTSITSQGGIIGETSTGIRCYAGPGRDDRWFREDLFNPVMPWEKYESISAI